MTQRLQHADWLTGRVPDGVRVQIRRLIEVMGYLPHQQPLGVVTADAVLLAANRPLLDLLGTAGDELLGAEWCDVMPAWEARTRTWDDEDIEPRTRTFEEHVVVAGGRELWAHVVASPVLTDGDLDAGSGRVLAAWTLFVSDVSPRASDEEERRRREMLELLLESPGQYVVKLDGDGLLEFASPPLCRLLGRPACELLGRTLQEARADGGVFDGGFAGLLEELAAPPFYARRETAVRAPDGEHTVLWTFEALIEDRGTVRGVFGVGRDISDRRESEEAMRHRLELETMLATISSRFRDAEVGDTEAAFEFALAQVGHVTGVDGVGVYEFAVDRLTVETRRTWRRPSTGVASTPALTSLEDLPWLRERLEAHAIVVVGDVDDLPPEANDERELWRSRGIRSVLLAPLVLDGLLFGFLSLCTSHEPRTWSDDDLHLLRVLADELMGELAWFRDSGNLAAVSEAFLSFGPECDRNIEAICRALGSVTGADFVLYERREGDDLSIAASWNAPEGLSGALASGGAGADVIRRGGDDVHTVHDFQDSLYGHSSPTVRALGLRTYAGYPVRADAQTVASLGVLFTSAAELRTSQLELFRVLGRAAAVEESRRLAEGVRIRGLAQLEQAMERTVATLSGAMSTRDPYTAGHERRVAELAVAIGSGMGLGDEPLRMLRLAATVHDIGKIAVPAEILSKPTRLSEAEFAIIKRHSEAGLELLQPAELPDEVLMAVLQHHERLDGSGYPAGLAGDDISLFARILAVSDVAEAMSSHRPYRPALGVEPALQEIERGRGTSYDERVCDLCLDLFREQGFSFDE